MRGRKKDLNQQMRMGRTIVAEREHAESDSERLMARKKVHRKKITSVIMILLIMSTFGLLIYMGLKEFMMQNAPVETGAEQGREIRAEIVDEDNRGQMTARMRNFILQLEDDLADLGQMVTRVTIPTGMSRELLIDLEGREGYFKVNIDRQTAETAEDILRMIHYIDDKDLHPQYIDVRLEGKAYYK